MENLTEREITIASYAAKGWSVRQIADEMYLSPETIKWYRKRMLRKTQTTTFAELVAMLKDENII